MTRPAGDRWPDLAEALVVFLSLLVPVFVAVVVVGPSREVLLSLAGYGVFVLGSLVLTALVWDRSSDADE